MLLRSSALSARPGLVHGFTTRLGPAGVPLTLDVSGASASWQLVVEQVGLPGAPLATAVQVHGAQVFTVQGGGVAGDGDALVTHRPGLLLAVCTADCVPVLVAGDGVVAAIHAGWRGVVAGTVRAGVAAMGQGGDLVAAIGPCICGRCYEVGDEVVQGILGAGVPLEVFLRGGSRPHVDLRAAVRWQLRAAGVHAVDDVDYCTLEDPRLHSYRGQGAAAGRMAAVIGLRP